MKSSTAFFMSTLKASTCCFERETKGQRIFPVGMMGKALTHIMRIE